MFLAWPSDELSCRQNSWYTVGHLDTDRCRQRQYSGAKTGVGKKMALTMLNPTCPQSLAFLFQLRYFRHMYIAVWWQIFIRTYKTFPIKFPQGCHILTIDVPIMKSTGSQPLTQYDAVSQCQNYGCCKDVNENHNKLEWLLWLATLEREKFDSLPQIYKIWIKI